MVAIRIHTEHNYVKGSFYPASHYIAVHGVVWDNPADKENRQPRVFLVNDSGPYGVTGKGGTLLTENKIFDIAVPTGLGRHISAVEIGDRWLGSYYDITIDGQTIRSFANMISF